MSWPWFAAMPYAHGPRLAIDMSEYDRPCMCDEDAAAPAVMSVRPPWASMLVDGEKTIELRRRAPGLAGRVACVYETAPVSAVVGTVQLCWGRQGPPERLWDRMSMDGRVGMSREEYDAWCDGAAAITAIRTGIVRRWRTPRTLAALRLEMPGWRPPVSWRIMRVPERHVLLGCAG